MSDGFSRCLAAWLLTLPGPFAASSEEEAMELARTSFGADVSLSAFKAAFLDFGYVLRADGGVFRIAGICDEAPAHRAGKRRAHRIHAQSASSPPDKYAAPVLQVA